MVGAFAVGKTSLVKQYVDSIFNEKYHTTIGVKIDKRQLLINDNKVQLMIWDIEGVDIFTDLKSSYLRGASGVIIVTDGTRPNTLEVAQQLKVQIEKSTKHCQVILLINKNDLKQEWTFSDEKVKALKINKNNIFTTSAKSGNNVDKAFYRIAELMLQE